VEDLRRMKVSAMPPRSPRPEGGPEAWDKMAREAGGEGGGCSGSGTPRVGLLQPWGQALEGVVSAEDLLDVSRAGLGVASNPNVILPLVLSLEEEPEEETAEWSRGAVVLPETAVVHETLLALRGVPSHGVWSADCTFDPGVRIASLSALSLRRAVAPFAEGLKRLEVVRAFARENRGAGGLSRLHGDDIKGQKSVDRVSPWSQHARQSPVFQAAGACLGEWLNAHDAFCAAIEAELFFQRGPVEDKTHTLLVLSKKMHTRMAELSVLGSVLEQRARAEHRILADEKMLPSWPATRASMLLSGLHSALVEASNRGDRVAVQVLSRLMRCAGRPYIEQLAMWLGRGDLPTGSSDLFVLQSDTGRIDAGDRVAWLEGVTFVGDAAVPSFLAPCVDLVVVAGKSVNILRSVLDGVEEALEPLERLGVGISEEYDRGLRELEAQAGDQTTSTMTTVTTMSSGDVDPTAASGGDMEGVTGVAEALDPAFKEMQPWMSGLLDLGGGSVHKSEASSEEVWRLQGAYPHLTGTFVPTPIDVLLSRVLLAPIRAACDASVSRLRAHLLGPSRLVEHLTLLRAFVLMGAGDTWYEFGANLFERLRVGRQAAASGGDAIDVDQRWKDPHALTSLFQDVARHGASAGLGEIPVSKGAVSSHALETLRGGLDALQIEIDDESTRDLEADLGAELEVEEKGGHRAISKFDRGIRVTDSLSFSYSVPWPVNLVINAGSMAKYTRVARFLIQLKHCKHVLERIRLEGPGNERSRGNSASSRGVLVLQSRLLTFVNAVHEHMMSGVLGAPWTELVDGLTGPGTHVFRAQSLHDTYLKQVLGHCLLGPDRISVLVAGRIQRILAVVLELESLCWTAESLGPVRFDHGLRALAATFDESNSFLLRVVAGKVRANPESVFAGLLTRIDYNGFYSRKEDAKPAARATATAQPHL